METSLLYMMSYSRNLFRYHLKKGPIFKWLLGSDTSENRSSFQIQTNHMMFYYLNTKWLKDSGLVVNEEKTEVCLFHRRDHQTVYLTINGKQIMTKKTINVLGVVFDGKLQWTNQIKQAINKSKRALHGIKLIVFCSCSKNKVHRYRKVGRVHKFWSYSFGHINSVMWINLNETGLYQPC